MNMLTRDGMSERLRSRILALALALPAAPHAQWQQPVPPQTWQPYSQPQPDAPEAKAAAE